MAMAVSVNVFDLNPLFQMLMNLDYKNDLNDKHNQPTLMDLLLGH